MEFLAIVVLGWPSAVAGLACLISAIVLKNVRIGVVGAIVATGFCVYAMLYPPPLRWLGILALIGNYSGVFAIRRKYIPLAVAFLSPFVLLVALIARAVLIE